MDRATKHWTCVTLAFVVWLAVAMQGCATTYQLTSHWVDRKMEIDGNLKDWSDSTSFAEKDGIRFGVMNDKEYLYVCTFSSSPNLGRQLITRGMTVWFDPNGGEKKLLGVRFPIGAMGGRMMMRSEDGQRNRGNTGERPQGDQRQRLEEMEQESLNEFEFLGPGPDDRQRVSRIEGQGVEFHVTATRERFVYEMKIPLAYSSGHPYAVESYAGSTIGVGFDSSPMTRAMENGPGGGPAGEGTGGGRGGGRTGGMGGRGGGRAGGGMAPGGSRQQSSETVSFDIWAHVQLAEKGK